MAVPKSRRTKSNRDNRRMHIYLEEKALTACPNCGMKILPHRVCNYCGYYKGKPVLDMKEKAKKKEVEGDKSVKQGPLDIKKLSRKE